MPASLRGMCLRRQPRPWAIGAVLLAVAGWARAQPTPTPAPPVSCAYDDLTVPLGASSDDVNCTAGGVLPAGRTCSFAKGGYRCESVSCGVLGAWTSDVVACFAVNPGCSYLDVTAASTACGGAVCMGLNPQFTEERLWSDSQFVGGATAFPETFEAVRKKDALGSSLTGNVCATGYTFSPVAKFACAVKRGEAELSEQLCLVTTPAPPTPIPQTAGPPTPAPPTGAPPTGVPTLAPPTARPIVVPTAMPTGVPMTLIPLTPVPTAVPATRVPTTTVPGRIPVTRSPLASVTRVPVAATDAPTGDAPVQPPDDVDAPASNDDDDDGLREEYIALIILGGVCCLIVLCVALFVTIRKPKDGEVAGAGGADELKEPLHPPQETLDKGPGGYATPPPPPPVPEGVTKHPSVPTIPSDPWGAAPGAPAAPVQQQQQQQHQFSPYHSLAGSPSLTTPPRSGSGGQHLAHPPPQAAPARHGSLLAAYPVPSAQAPQQQPYQYAVQPRYSSTATGLPAVSPRRTTWPALADDTQHMPLYRSTSLAQQPSFRASPTAGGDSAAGMGLVPTERTLIDFHSRTHPSVLSTAPTGLQRERSLRSFQSGGAGGGSLALRRASSGRLREDELDARRASPPMSAGNGPGMVLYDAAAASPPGGGGGDTGDTFGGIFAPTRSAGAPNGTPAGSAHLSRTSPSGAAAGVRPKGLRKEALCHCGVPCELKPLAGQPDGRKFYSCESGKCGYFEWVDQ